MQEKALVNPNSEKIVEMADNANLATFVPMVGDC